MTKYYVKSGELERIITASDPRGACIKALMSAACGESVDDFFYVDERGFRSIEEGEPIMADTSPDCVIPYEDVMETVDEIDEFYEEMGDGKFDLDF